MENIKEINILKKGINSLNETLKSNEINHYRIIDSQIEIHKRQLNVSLAFVLIFTLFLLISGIYSKYLINQYKLIKMSEKIDSEKKVNIEISIKAINEMIEWSDKAEKEDIVYNYFLHNRYDDLKVYLNKQITDHHHHNDPKTIDNIILNNNNINKFYRYFEILKNYNNSNLLDHSVAFDMLYYFKNSGKDFKFIEKLRKRSHKKIDCDCGLIYNGYENIYKSIFLEDLVIDGNNDIPEN